MNTSLIKLAVVLLAPAMIVSSTAMGQGEKPPLPSFELQSVGAVPSTLMPSAFTYQGQLRQNNLPVTGPCSATFKLFDAETAGNQIGPAVTQPALQVQNGLFAIALDFGWGAFNGEARWLETAIGCSQRPVTLSPRTPLRPAPYALALPGLWTVPGLLDGSGNPTMNVIGGLVNGPISNTISPDSYNSVIAGGTNNRATSQSRYSFIGSGYNNLINDRSVASVIAGGESNRIDGYSTHSAIDGGNANEIVADSDQSAIVGGSGNIIDGSDYAAIIGGSGNHIDGAYYAAIPGGLQAKATFWGQQAQAAGGFASVTGTAQASTYVLRNVSTNDQITNLYLDGSSAEINLALGRGFLFDIQVIGESDSATNYDLGTYHFIGTVNNYGYMQLKYSKVVVHEDGGAVNWDADLASTPDKTFRIVVTGENGKNIRWVATVRTTEVEWPASTTMTAQDAPVPEKK